MDLWNQNYVISNTDQRDFMFEIDKAFSIIEQGLFDSLVIAKSFHYSIEPSGYGFYADIVVVPNSIQIKPLATFIGPSVHFINIMKGKLAAEAAVEKYDIPMLPGGDPAIQARVWRWNPVDEITTDCIFKYIDLFDWSTEEGMDCEFFRARLTESTLMKEYVGFDFLFKYDEVQIINTKP